MEEWKFLLQKDGDRSWLPLDSTDVEILEGRYRIVARCSQPNTDISIRICHLATEEAPPKRRIQKRSGRTNQNGLMVVIPFAHLQSGLWEFSCFLTDPMSELLGDTWHYSVRLQVAAPVSEQIDDYQGGDDEDNDDFGTVPAIVADADPVVQEAMHWQPAFLVEHPSIELPIEQGLVETAAVDPDRLAVSGSVTDFSVVPVVNELAQPASAESVPTVRELAVLNIEIAQALGLSMDRLVEMTEQLSHRLIEDVFREFNLVPAAHGVMGDGVMGDAVVSDQVISDQVIGDEMVSDGEIERGVEAELDEAVQSAAMVLDASTLCFVLEQEVFTASRGQALRIAGRVDTQENVRLTPQLWAEPFLAATSMGLIPTRTADQALAGFSGEAGAETTDTRGAIAQEIQIHLRNPQTSEILCRDRQPLASGLPPFPFVFCFDLPPDLTTHLIVGEVALYGGLPDSEEPLAALTTHAFTVTVDPAGLLQELEKVHATLQEENVQALELAELATQFSTRFHQEPKPVSLDLSFLNFTATVREEPHSSPPEASTKAVETVATAVRPTAVAKKAQVLPPLLYQPNPEQATKKRLELPIFANSKVVKSNLGSTSGSQDTTPESDPARDSQAVATAEVGQWTDLDMLFSRGPSLPDTTPDLDSFGNPADLVAMELAMQETALAEGLNPEGSVGDAAVVSAPAIADGPDAVGTENLPTMPLEIRVDFQALNLQDRFLGRLNALASDPELSTQLKQETDLQTIAARSTETPDGSVANPSDRPSDSLLSDAMLVEAAMLGEVVVEDDPSWRDWARRSGIRTKSAPTHEGQEPTNLPLLPADHPVPVPVIEILTEEIIAGLPINVRVKLPNLVPKIYVKLWVNDRQTRTLLDGPRWLVDFMPNGLGELIAFTQLTAPFGSLGIRLEAIAVEMGTQRESQKVGSDRTIAPEEIPDLFLDDLDF